MSQAELLKGNAVMLILRIISIEQRHGYDIIKELERRSEGVFKFKEGTLYPILHSLEAEKYIHSRWEDTESRRRRKYYSITPSGKDELIRRTVEWREFAKSIDTVMEGVVRYD